MKVFQILNNICHWDATPLHPTLEDTLGKYAPNIIFIEAPNHVFEGWGFDNEAMGNDRFIQPEPPMHWLYDVNTGTFYPDPNNPPPGFVYDPETGMVIPDLKYMV